MHSGTFEACADGHLATGLYNARRSTQALGVKLRIAHTLAVSLEIVETTASLIGARDLAPDRGE